MGKSEAEMSFKSDKVSSPKGEADIHSYPDWASIQVYYGSGVPLLAPYFNSTVLGGHFPYPFVCAPPQSYVPSETMISQPIFPPYWVPYTAFYPHGGVHAHPAVPLVATPLSKINHSKAAVVMDQGVTKKFKRLDGLAVPVGNRTTGEDAGGSVNEHLQSVKHGIDGFTDGSNGNSGAIQPQRNSSSEGILSSDNEGNSHRLAGSLSDGKVYAAADKVPLNTVVPIDVAQSSIRPFSRTEQTHAFCVASSTSAGFPFESVYWRNGSSFSQEEQQLKQERRKQANRESAKRSRMRKQSENEELISRLKTLNEENKALKFEISKLTENLDKASLENTALQEKLKKKQQLELQCVMVPCKKEPNLALPNKLEGENVNSETKLNQVTARFNYADIAHDSAENFEEFLRVKRDGFLL